MAIITQCQYEQLREADRVILLALRRQLVAVADGLPTGPPIDEELARIDEFLARFNQPKGEPQ